MSNTDLNEREKSSEDILAENIVTELFEAGLIRFGKIEEFSLKLGNGILAEKDWGLEIELATEEGGKNVRED